MKMNERKEKEDILEELTTIWQQHSESLEEIARHHDLTKLRLTPRPLVFSSRRRSVFSYLAVTFICVAAIAGIVILRRQYVYDTFDMIFFLLLSLALSFTAIQNIARAYSSLRQSSDSTRINYHESVSPLRYSIPRATVFATVVVLFLFIVVPLQNGRSMSLDTESQRSEAITNVSYVLSHIK